MLYHNSTQTKKYVASEACPLYKDQLQEAWSGHDRDWSVYCKNGGFFVNPLPIRVNDESISSFLSHVPRQKEGDRQVLLEKLLDALKNAIPKKCYRCHKTNFQTKGEYIRHCVIRHPGLPAYPGPADILAEKLQSQNMLWEKR